MVEEWKPVSLPLYSDYYSISNMGRVYSKHRNKIMIPVKSQTGYLCVKLCVNNIQKRIAIHRLVAMAFIPNPDNKPTVNHKDECKENNCVDNLEWMTNAEQNIHGTRIERAIKHTDYKARNINYYEIAQKHDYSKQNMCGRKKCNVYKNGILIGQYNSQHEASKAVGVSEGKVSQCINGQKESCKGFTFSHFEEEVN